MWHTENCVPFFMFAATAISGDYLCKLPPWPIAGFTARPAKWGI
jgi:hypothetical protein